MPARRDTKGELIDTGTDKRYVRRDVKALFTESKSSQGDRGDRRRSK